MNSEITPLALLPLRGGSRGIPHKNVRSFLGKPLFTWCANAAIEAGLQLVISTEDCAIKSMVREYTPSAIILDRPDELASDTATTESVIEHAFDNIDCEHMLLLQATSPLTRGHEISEAISAYVQGALKPLISGTRQHQFLWDNLGFPINYNPYLRPRRQDWDGSFVENGAIYIFSQSDFRKSQCRCPPPCTLFSMNPQHSIELDTLDDWALLEEQARRIYASSSQ